MEQYCTAPYILWRSISPLVGRFIGPFSYQIGWCCTVIFTKQYHHIHVLRRAQFYKEQSFCLTLHIVATENFRVTLSGPGSDKSLPVRPGIYDVHDKPG